MSASNVRERAQRYLASAEILIGEGDLESSVSRSYYAMFYLARALLNNLGHTPKTHQGVHRLFDQHFLKDGPLTPEESRAFSLAEELRGLADYSNDFVIEREQAEAVLRDAHTFVAKLEPLLKELGP